MSCGETPFDLCSQYTRFSGRLTRTVGSSKGRWGQSVTALNATPAGTNRAIRRLENIR